MPRVGLTSQVNCDKVASRRFPVSTFVVKHVLPDGTTAGYHADSTCTVSRKRDGAKEYEDHGDSKNVAEQLEVVRGNFEYVWSVSEKYRNYEIWRGFELNQIRTEAEIVAN